MMHHEDAVFFLLKTTNDILIEKAEEFIRPYSDKIRKKVTKFFK
jgi:hypothetical protein